MNLKEKFDKMVNDIKLKNAKDIHQDIKDITEDDVKKIKLSPSKTFPVLLYWMVIFAITLFLTVIFGLIDLNLQLMCWITGGICFAYMGMEYWYTYMQNKKLPEGRTAIPNIDRYKSIVIYWLTINAIVIGLYAWKKYANLPVYDCIGLSGLLSGEYVAGNKSNKIGNAINNTAQNNSNLDTNAQSQTSGETKNE